MDGASYAGVPAGMSIGPHEMMLLHRRDTGNAFDLVTVTFPPHEASSPTTADVGHARGCVVLRGTLAITIGERTITVQPGEAIYIAPGVPHTYWNPTATVVEVLLIITPCAHADRPDHRATPSCHPPITTSLP